MKERTLNVFSEIDSATLSPRYENLRRSQQTRFKPDQQAASTRGSPRLIRLKLPEVQRSIPVPTLKLVNLKLKQDDSKT